jgi:hypothetical protein
MKGAKIFNFFMILAIAGMIGSCGKSNKDEGAGSHHNPFGVTPQISGTPQATSSFSAFIGQVAAGNFEAPRNELASYHYRKIDNPPAEEEVDYRDLTPKQLRKLVKKRREEFLKRNRFNRSKRFKVSLSCAGNCGDFERSYSLAGLIESDIPEDIEGNNIYLRKRQLVDLMQKATDARVALSPFNGFMGGNVTSGTIWDFQIGDEFYRIDLNVPLVANPTMYYNVQTGKGYIFIPVTY